jgi:hypothetical protein
MTQNPVTLDDLKRYGNIPQAYRDLLGEIARVTYRGTPFGQIPRDMASASAYETELEKQRQEAEHALLGLALAKDLPAEILAFNDKPDVDVRYKDGSLGGVEVVRDVYQALKQGDAENAEIQKALKEAISSSPTRGHAMMGRHIAVVQREDPRRALHALIVGGVLAWVDAGFPGATAGDVHVVLTEGQSALANIGVSLRLGTMPGTGWELTVGTSAQALPVLDLATFVKNWITEKRRKARAYRYAEGLRLVMPIVGFHPDPLVAEDLARLRVEQFDIEPFVRVIVYRDLDCVVFEPAR